MNVTKARSKGEQIADILTKCNIAQIREAGGYLYRHQREVLSFLEGGIRHERESPIAGDPEYQELEKIEN